MEGADESTELWLHPVDEMANYVNLSAAVQAIWLVKISHVTQAEEPISMLDEITNYVNLSAACSSNLVGQNQSRDIG